METSPILIMTLPGGKPFLIGIAGGSCSGKSTLARRLAGQLARARPSPNAVTLVSLDWYYRDLSHLEMAQRAKCNFDEPYALDHGLLREQLESLARGRAVDAPRYDFSTHTRLSETQRIAPGRFVIVEGLFALYWEDVRRLLGFKVFIETPDDVCLARRQARDVLERGRTPECVLARYTESVRPMHERYVLPTRAFADAVVSGEGPAGHVAAHLAARVEQEATPRKPIG